jgi:hypothetical protein
MARVMGGWRCNACFSSPELGSKISFYQDSQADSEKSKQRLRQSVDFYLNMLRHSTFMFSCQGEVVGLLTVPRCPKTTFFE